MRSFNDRTTPRYLADFCEHEGVGKACESCRVRINKAAPPATEEQVWDTARALAEKNFEEMGVSIQKVTADVVAQFIPNARMALLDERYATMEKAHEEYRRERSREIRAAMARTKERTSAS